MAGLSEKINNILRDIDSNIKDPSDVEYVKSKIMELTTTFIESMDNMIGLQASQEQIERKLKRIQNKVSQIEEDIYMDLDDEPEDDCCDSCGCGCNESDDGCEFEISCPYCGDAFIIEQDLQDESEIECPNCKNIIELDWDEPTSCQGGCGNCSSGCYSDEDEEIDSIAEDEEEYNSNANQVSNESISNSNSENSTNSNSSNNQGQNKSNTQNGGNTDNLQNGNVGNIQNDNTNNGQEDTKTNNEDDM